MTTIKEIALECGVSANTVSCVLNNRLGEVGPATRERVLNAIRRLGYRPNAAARRMVGKSTNTIGIADSYTANSTSDPYKVQLVEPIIHAARVRHRHVLYYSGHIDLDGFTSFLDGRSDGLICISGGIGNDDLEAFLHTTLPIVFIGTAQREEIRDRTAGIDVDNEAGAYLAVSHLTGFGHTRIAMLQGVGISGNAERTNGYKKALRDAQIEVDESLIYPTIAWDVSAYETTKKILAAPSYQRPSAIFCFNDVMAFAVLRAALDVDVAVPDELSVVGFDDVTSSSTTVPALTTVRQPLEWIGERSVEILIDILEGRLPNSYHEVVEPNLVVRSSTRRHFA